jgi:hypothetical protein
MEDFGRFFLHLAIGSPDRLVGSATDGSNHSENLAPTQKWPPSVARASVVRFVSAANSPRSNRSAWIEEENLREDVNDGARSATADRATDARGNGGRDRPSSSGNSGPVQQTQRRNVRGGAAKANLDTQAPVQTSDADGAPALVTCPRCGALTDPDIDCRETLACPGDPDQQLFAPWMRDGKVYDLKNPFDRDSIRGPLEEQIRKTADYRALVCRLSRLGRLSNADAISAETEATWDRLMIVHDRLNELDEQRLNELDEQ